MRLDPFHRALVIYETLGRGGGACAATRNAARAVAAARACNRRIGRIERRLQLRVAQGVHVRRAREEAEEERHAAEVAKLKAANEALKESLEALLAPPQKK